MGFPRPGYDYVPCDMCIADPQFLQLQNFWSEVLQDWFKYFNMKAPLLGTQYSRIPRKDDLQVLWRGNSLYDLELNTALASDMRWIFIAVAFTFAYMNYHLGSAFVAFASVAQIFFSLPVGMFFYWHVFGMVYFGSLNALVIFIVLGVGADDVFVLVDSWKQTKYRLLKEEGESDASHIQRRLYAATNHAKAAVFNTSFTSAVAFVATAASPLMTIRTFGAYAAIGVVLNYVMVIAITPAVLVINESWDGGFEAGWGPRLFRRRCFGKTVATPTQQSTPVPVFYKYVYLPLLLTKRKLGAMILVALSLIMGYAGLSAALQLTVPADVESLYGEVTLNSTCFAKVTIPR